MANELLLMGAKKTAHEVLFKISDSKKQKGRAQIENFGPI